MNSIKLLPVALLAVLLAAPTESQSPKPNVAILIYDGVQIIDHAVPYEVFGQFSLNNVYTVAKNPEPITTYMGMRVLPTHTFADAPKPDVLVLPGGDAGEAVRDPEIAAWIQRTAASADHVLTICTGTFFLVGTGLLEGARVTTWYDRQAELASLVPEAEVVGGAIVVESGKLVTAAGLGVEGSLRVLARLHGEAWAEVVRLNMEHEPIPASHHVPRVDLADLNLPDAVYGAFPWRTAVLERFQGDRDAWTMTWRFPSAAPLESVRKRVAAAVATSERWTLADQDHLADGWRSRWSIDGRDGMPWAGEVTLSPVAGDLRIEISVHRTAEHRSSSIDHRASIIEHRSSSIDHRPAPGLIPSPVSRR